MISSTMPFEPENSAKSGVNDTDSNLLRLAKIAGALNVFNTLAFSSDGTSSIGEDARKTLRAIRQLAGEEEHSETFFTTVTRKLSSNEYVLARELETIHPQVLKALSGTQSLQSSAHSGLLLSGLKGSGKSEYPLFLRSFLPDTPFFSINPNILRGHSNPPKFLEALLTDLQTQAIAQSKIFVLFLDEFDAIVTAGGKSFSQTKTSHNENVGSKRIQSSSTKEETNSLETDALGAQLLNTLKTLVGSAELDRVFLIATTNLTDLPDAIHRSGRLKKVEMGPLGWSYPTSYGASFIYDSYRDIIPRVLDILQATHYRITKTDSQIITQLRADVVSVFNDLPRHIELIEKGPKGKQILSARRDDDSILKIDENNATLKCILQFFQYDSSNHSRYQSGRDFNTHSDYFKIENGALSKNVTEEIRAALSMTPAFIAAYYKENKESFSNPDLALVALRELLFPQLKGWTDV